MHDSQKLDDVLDLSNTGKELWADSAYRSAQIEAGLKAKGLRSRIHRRAARNRPLSERVVGHAILPDALHHAILPDALHNEGVTRISHDVGGSASSPHVPYNS